MSDADRAGKPAGSGEGPPDRPARHSGRRAGDSGTRDAIRSAAAQQFAERGFDRTSLRSIAAQAGVDPGLVTHFFGSKHKLFVAVSDLPFDPAVVVPTLFSHGSEAVGERLASFMAHALEDPGARQRITGLVRAAASEPEAAALLRERLSRDVFSRIVAALGVQDADLRASLVASQMIGLVMARHVVGIEPLASLPPDAVAAAIAPNLQRYLTGPLGLPGAG